MISESGTFLSKCTSWVATTTVVRLRAERLGTVLGVAAVVATIGLGGTGRDGAIVGATIALLSLASAPLVRRWTSSQPPVIAIIATHLAVVAVATRVGGLRSDAAPAAAIGLAALAAGIGALVLVTRRLTHEERS